MIEVIAKKIYVDYSGGFATKRINLKIRNHASHAIEFRDRLYRADRNYSKTIFQTYEEFCNWLYR